MIGNELLNWFGIAQSLSIAILTFGMEWLLLYAMYERKYLYGFNPYFSELVNRLRFD